MSRRPVLVYRTGSLGDTLVALPALWVVREAYADAQITILSDVQVGRDYVRASDLLRDSGVADDFIDYPVPGGLARMTRPLTLARLWMDLRGRRFGTLVYLAPSRRPTSSIMRDRRFFKTVGIGSIVGMDGPFLSAFTGEPSRPLRTVPHESDLLLARLRHSGLAVPGAGLGRTELPSTQVVRDAFARWLRSLGQDGGRTWVAVGPGSKMPAKIWPRERYESVVRKTIEEFDVWPVVFGGPEDREAGDWLLARWGRGYNAAGVLGVRESLEALRRCALYLGNDTGTMHLAVAAGLKCVSVFSSRAHPGNWYPYGRGHSVFRTAIDCEGCGLVECIDRDMACVKRIDVEEVYRAVATQLQSIGAAGAV